MGTLRGFDQPHFAVVGAAQDQEFALPFTAIQPSPEPPTCNAHQRLFDNPPLLRDTASLPRGRTQQLTVTGVTPNPHYGGWSVWKM